MKAKLMLLGLGVVVLAVFLYGMHYVFQQLSRSIEIAVANALRDPTEELAAQLPRIPPKEPAEALTTFQIRDGFRMDLLAAEPLVTSPVAMEYDENGRAFVVEMVYSPYTAQTTAKPFT